MKLLDLFSGIGGFSLAAECNNIETIGFVEKDIFCQKVLQKNFPGIPIIGDIRDVKKETFEPVDIVSGGFPCQPFSVAGKRRGTDDDRYLWDETIRVVSVYKPRWFIGENVEGIVNIQNGLVLRQVQDDLEKEGFEVQCGIIPASGVGAWHQRKRVWIIGHNVSDTNSRLNIGKNKEVQTRGSSIDNGSKNVCNAQHNGSSTTQEQRGNDQTSTGSQKGENSSLQSERTGRPTDNGNVSNTECLGFSERSSIRGLHKKEPNDSNNFSDKSKTGTKNGNVSNTHDSRFQDWTKQCEGESTQERERQPSTSRQSSVSDSERRQGSDFPNDRGFSKLSRKEIPRNRSCTPKQRSVKSWWQIESELRGVPNGVSFELDKGRVNRLKALGNSIVPQIAYQLFKAIITIDKEE
jgi:DNA (cytosine-5)-methyltransferase 1